MEYVSWRQLHTAILNVVNNNLHQIHTGRAPQYLAHAVQLIAESSRRPGLTSVDTADYVKRRILTKFGERCFQSRRSSCLEFLIWQY